MIARVGRYIDVLFPPTESSGALEAEWSQWSADAAGSYCPRCGATAAREAITIHGCPHCRQRSVPWHGVWRLGAYHQPLARWVVRYKFRGMWAWGSWFGRRLAKRTPDGGPAVVVPVPLHWRRRVGRGYDQAHLVAEAFAEAKRLPMARLLNRRRATRPQTHLRDQRKRRANVRGAFAAHPIDLSGYTVWLVDDVKTSGSTAGLCARLLRRAGAERVNLAVVAVADPKAGDFQWT